MALNLSKNKIDKLIALLGESDESSDLDDDEDHEDEEEEDEKKNIKIDINIKSEILDCIENETTIPDEKPTTELIKVVKLEYKPIELEDSSGTDDNDNSAPEDDPNDPLNIKIGDKELNLDLLYPEQETKETDLGLSTITTTTIKKEDKPKSANEKIVVKDEKKSPVPFKKKKSRIPLEKRVRCTICKAQRKNEEYLDLHMKTHEGKSEYECHVCGKFFSTTASVVRHQSLHEAAYKHQCEKCGKRFIFSSSLYSHKARHDDSRPFSCTVCGQTFKATKHLKRHMFIHTGERPFVCTVCGKAYSMKYMLKSHFRVHTRERHVCKICQKSFKRQNDFERHMDWHVTGVNKKDLQKPRKPRKKKIPNTEVNQPSQQPPSLPSQSVPTTNINDDILNVNMAAVAAVAAANNSIDSSSIPPIPFQIPLFGRFNNINS